MRMETKLTPAHAAKQICQALKAEGKPARAAQSRKFFKDDEDVQFYGLSVPEARQVEREFFAAVKPYWTVAEAFALCDLLIRDSHLEAKQIGIEVLARFKRKFSPALFDTSKEWLTKNYCGNWATTDAFCSLVLGPLVQMYPVLLVDLHHWTQDRNLWVRRAAAVSLVSAARRGLYLEDAYQVAVALRDYPEDLIHKAVGWLLREAGRTDAARLESFLLAQGARLPRTALRYAIEKFPPEKRKWLLEQTKP